MNHPEDFDPLSPELYSGFGDDDDGLRFLPKMPLRGPDLGGAAPVSLQVECNSEVRAGETKVAMSQDEIGSIGRLVGVAPPMATVTYVTQPMLSPPQQMLQPQMLVAPQLQMHAVPHHAHPPGRVPPPDYNNRKSDDTYDTRCNIYVASMPRTFDDHKLAQYFSRFGPIVSAKVMCDHATGISKGYGFVLFKNEESAARAVNEMAGQQVEGMRIQVRWAHFDATPTTRSTSYAVGTTNTGTLAINTAETASMRAPNVVHPSAAGHQGPGAPLQINSALSSPQGSFTSNNSPSHAPPAYGAPVADLNRPSKPAVVTAPQQMVAPQWYAHHQPATVPMMVQYPVTVPYMMPAQGYPAPQPYPMMMLSDPSLMGQPRMVPQQPTDGYYMLPASATTAPPPGAIYVPSRKR